MFSNLTKYEFVRNGKQAIGFYLSYLLLALIIGAVLGGIAGVLMKGNPFEAGLFIGKIFAFILCLSLAIVITVKKAQFSSFKAIIMIAITALLALVIGSLGGLIPVAYLTTLSNAKIDEQQGS